MSALLSDEEFDLLVEWADPTIQCPPPFASAWQSQMVLCETLENERAARIEAEAALAEARLVPTCIRGEIASLYAEYGAHDRPNSEAVFSAIRKGEQVARDLALSRAAEREAGPS